MKGTGCPSTRGCPSPMNWEIASMDCCTAVSWFGMRRMQSVIVTVAYATFARLFFFISLSPTLLLHSLILSFSLILSIHVTFILSYPFTFTFTLTHSLSSFYKCWLFFMTSYRRKAKVSTRKKGDGLHRPTRKPPGYLLTRRVIPGRLPR